MNLCTEPSRTSVSVNYLAQNALSMWGKNSARTENSTQVGSLPFIVGNLSWITGQAMFCTYHVSIVRQSTSAPWQRILQSLSTIQKQCWTFYRNPMYLMLAHRMSNLFAIRSRHIAFFKWVMTLSLCQINDQACVGGILHSVWYSDEWPSLWLLDTRTSWSFKKEQMARAAQGPRAGCGYYMHMHTRLMCVHQPYYVEIVLPQWSEGV